MSALLETETKSQNVICDYELTADDIRALKQATTLCFDWNRRLGTAGIRAIREIDGQDDYTHRIPCASSLTDYGNGTFEKYDSDRYSGFVMIGAAHFNDHARAIVALVRKGDKLSLKWVANNNTANIRNAGLHGDDLDLVVKRNGNPFVLHVDHRCSPDDLARMLRS